MKAVTSASCPVMDPRQIVSLDEFEKVIWSFLLAKYIFRLFVDIHLQLY